METPDFDAPAPKVQSPSTLAHVVLRTPNVRVMENFFVTFLGGRVAHRNDVLSFITYDEEHHRIALLELPAKGPRVRSSYGLEHIAFSYATLSDLMLSYRQRKDRGISPIWCVNHGPTTSIYYKDPDGNVLETQVDNFDTPDEANQFMSTEAFAENPIGTDFDPEEMIRKLKAGEDDKVLKRRNEIGPRGPPDLDSA
ncbi:Glyoxalase/Bleomycin resistance protein/Dihydroxybiphenyl dioxygenase [Aspergillus caelatus]|uniref:Glyoxalase/Bleomycin resistance protein/Dihydroxybiphenyl dioxygenase n=2 Tax=Aspergillus subgen. Circumdati TaxID=2720871 RepID=A0A5N7A9E0_9EURO|nr:Glyoxalase/Bleomycin resistance protein/Dihydroxybiphenyl dioxygenase [Aspergillus caelatus]KAE8366464.1 Glyoxalase/Bleomycin resistance protein/Dihydroxybiphenyl dioxygenase [Aspergillus caelatus]KAE8421241.1 Glyoxalase/Bleomycin resistance protein/Dihydroxybiphenyl dioxygenase [Aspergillus pseudocaelatus]